MSPPTGRVVNDVLAVSAMNDWLQASFKLLCAKTDSVALAAVLDVDGTLVDTNYQHAIAWYRAFRQNGKILPIWRIHRHIGMGGDQLVAALAGEEWDEEHGDDVRTAEKALYLALIEEVEPLEGARELIEELKERGHSVVLASSAKADEVDHYLDLLDARELADDWTTSADVERDEARARPRARPRSRRLRRTRR